MAKNLDVYRDWLGIQEAARPLSYYQLLRLAKFEDDASKIRAHYRKMNAHVRKFATGDFAAESQALLNELARAMLCLTDAQRKREYDATLGRADQGGLRRRSFEEILLGNKIVDQAQLDKARNFAKAIGLEVRDAVLQQKLAAPDVVMLAYAEAIGLPYVELEDIGVLEELVPLVPPTAARQHSFVPVIADAAQVLVASPNPLVPDVEEDLRLRFGKQVRTVLCTAASVNEALAKYFPPDAPPVAAPAAKAAKPSATPAAAAPAKAPAAPATAEEKRQRILLTVVIFNLAVMLCIFLVFAPLRGGLMRLGVVDLGLTVILASILAAVAYVLLPKFTS